MKEQPGGKQQSSLKSQRVDGPAFRRWLADEEREIRGLQDYPILKFGYLLTRFPGQRLSQLDAPELARLRGLFIKALGGSGDVARDIIEPGPGLDPRIKLSPFSLTWYGVALDALREEIANLFRKLAEGKSISIEITQGRVRFDCHRGNWTRRYENNLSSGFHLNFIDELQRLGFGSLRKCPVCGRVLIGVGKRIFCTRRCSEAHKTNLYRSSPDARERHVFRVFKADYYKTNKALPDRKRVEQWLVKHRGLQKKKGKRQSKQTLDSLMLATRKPAA